MKYVRFGLKIGKRIIFVYEKKEDSRKKLSPKETDTSINDKGKEVDTYA